MELWNELNAGNAVTIGYGFYDSNGIRMNGHSVTLWGFSCDTTVTFSNSDFFKGVVVTDSDDSIVSSNMNPADAQNNLRLEHISWDSSLNTYELNPGLQSITF